MTADLAAFLNARYDETEATAQKCAEVYPPPWDVSDRGWVARVRADAPDFPIVAELEQDPGGDGWLGDRLEHIALHDPARILADIAAKRRIIAEYEASVRAVGDGLSAPEHRIIHYLASVYADHEDYQPEWKP